MPQRTLLLGLLWLALAALLGLLALLLSLPREAGSAVDAALALNLILLPLPLLGWLGLRRSSSAGAAAPDTTPEQPAGTEARARFLAQVGHELRTPMNAIMGMTQLALQTSLTAEQRHLLNKADAASRTLLSLINDLLDASRIESGTLQLEIQPLRLEEVVAQAIERVRPLHGSSAVALVCDWGDASLLAARGQLRGDALRLQQVLINLLSNAIKFTPAGRVVLQVSAGATDAAGRVPLRLAVQDTGIGMSATQLAGLFHEFRPGDIEHHRRHGGTGLGLALARRLLELMGGQLVVQSQPGQGSRFEIQIALPLDADAPPPPPPKPRRVLVAQPAASGAEATLRLLGHLGLGDGAAGTTDSAATLARLNEARQAGRPFDWLLLAWTLPGAGATGADLLALLRREHPALRIALLCPPGLEDGPLQARGLGARELCPEPLLPADLRRLLDGSPARHAALDAQALAGLRVLLVEDHPINQEIALRLLTGRGAAVEVAANGQDCLDRLRASGPAAFDVVLMDLEMPVLDGLDTTRQLRQLPGFATLPVLAMTAHALAEERAECLAAGMQGHIAKPLDVPHLVRELQRYRPAPPTAAAPPVLDMAVGLNQFGGQVALYRRTMQAFIEFYGHGLAGWSTWLGTGEWTELRRAAHTLQGLAATLGAQPLHRTALALERSAAATDVAGADEHLSRAESALSTLLAEARQALAEDAGTSVIPSGAGDLAELQLLLSQSDSRALDWWQAHGPVSGLDAGTRQRLDQALAGLDFDTAAAALAVALKGGR